MKWLLDMIDKNEKNKETELLKLKSEIVELTRVLEIQMQRLANGQPNTFAITLFRLKEKSETYSEATQKHYVCSLILEL